MLKQERENYLKGISNKEPKEQKTSQNEEQDQQNNEEIKEDSTGQIVNKKLDLKDIFDHYRPDKVAKPYEENIA